MSKTKKSEFTEQEINILKANPYTYKVTNRVIYFTKEFKQEFYRRNLCGYTPRQIVKELGYDPEMLGDVRLTGIQMSVKKQAESAVGLHEGTVSKKLRSELTKDKMPCRETVEWMQHEILYLHQEVEFLKKIYSLKDEKK